MALDRLSDEERADIETLIQRAVAEQLGQARREVGAPPVISGISANELRALTEHGRMLILPGDGRSHYLYAFLLDDAGSAFARLRVRKRDMADFWRAQVAEHGRESIGGARVHMRGTFPLKRAAATSK